MSARNLPVVRANLIDRAINYVAPVYGAARMQARARQEVYAAMGGGYEGARGDISVFARWIASAGSADRDVSADLPSLRARSGDLYRNAPLATGAVNTVCTNVVGTGLVPMPRIDRDLLGLSEKAADAIERSAWREFSLFANSQECDVRRTLVFTGQQDLSLRSSLVRGDCFVLPRYKPTSYHPYGLKLQLIEGDRCSNPQHRPDSPTLVSGVEMDGDGAPIAYHFSNRHPGSIMGGALTWTRVPAFGAKSGRRNVLHIYKPDRIDQTRGVPYLAPVIGLLKQLTRYGDAEIMAAVLNACFAAVTKTESGAGLPPSEGSSEDSNSLDRMNIEFEAGMVLDGLKPNESFENMTPGRPNAAFDGFVQAVLRQVGVALELPFEILVKHFTASYSAARAALLEAWKFFRTRRAWLATYLCQPVYEMLLTEAVALGRLAMPGFFEDPLIRAAWCGCEWVGPGMGQINEKDETDAALARAAGGLSTLEQETARLTGGDWERNHAQRAKEKRRRVADGLEAPAEAAAPAAAGAGERRSPANEPDKPEGPDKPDQQEAA